MDENAGDNQEKQAKSKENADAKASSRTTAKTIPNCTNHTCGWWSDKIEYKGECDAPGEGVSLLFYLQQK